MHIHETFSPLKEKFCIAVQPRDILNLLYNAAMPIANQTCITVIPVLWYQWGGDNPTACTNFDKTHMPGRLLPAFNIL